MVKFSREYDATVIPEWKAAFVDYKCLKKLIKRVKITRRDDASAGHLLPPQEHHVGFSVVLDPVRALFSGKPALAHGAASPPEEDHDGLEPDSAGELVRSTDTQEREFLEKADEELAKVNRFYASQEEELLTRGKALMEQLDILVDVKKIIADHSSRSSRRSNESSDRHLLSSGMASPQSMSDGSAELRVAVADEVMAALERNGVSFVGSKAKKKKQPQLGTARRGLPSTVRIDIPPTSPGRAALKVWEELFNVLRKDGADPAAAFVHRRKVQHADKNIRDAFLALYRGLELLKKFSSLNVKAFTKILKKFVKVSEQRLATDLFLKKVKESQFSSSDKVLQLADEVECIFLRHFAGNDRKVAMKYLKPQQPRNTHMVTFLVGLFTGTFASLFIIYAILAHVAGIFSSSGNTVYMEIVYHVFSMFALTSLHIFLYGCNLFLWKRTRINNNYIFDFTSSTALTHRDAFLMSASIMCTVVAALVTNLFLRNASATYANSLPGALLLLSTGVLFCPFNIFYRSTRYCFMRIMRNIIFSPFYKVLMADFFMGDQLTSQIPLLRHLEFTACYFMASTFQTHAYSTCTNTAQYKHLAFVISFLPYYWRAMQCLRRYLEEGLDINQLANAGKYVSAIVAAAVRFNYVATPSPMWMYMVVISSIVATIYQLYWDFVKDWGFFTCNSKNFLLRDELILKNKPIYYVSVLLNVGLRLTWTESVMKLHHITKAESRLMDFSLASLEIIRRCHWNFYRLENEQLNNAGKFRVVKTVPLPFRELEID